MIERNDVLDHVLDSAHEVNAVKPSRIVFSPGAGGGPHTHPCPVVGSS